MTPKTLFADYLRERVGTQLCVTDSLTITQQDVDTFAHVTRDWDYMHNDPERAAHGPWGGTIAHGYFLVSLISHFMTEAGFPNLERDDPPERMMNYGLDRVRFTEPVRVGDRLRARLSLDGLEARKPGVALAKLLVKYETERCGDRPHMIAQVLMLVVYGDAVREAR